MSAHETNVTVQKHTKGRKRIEIKKIENKASLQVTFSKRRSGLFRKASQLSRLCQAEVAILVFSPYGRPYVFGHPSVDDVINRLESTSQTLHGSQHMSMHVSGSDDDNDSTTYQTSLNDEESISLGLACGSVMKEEKEEKEAVIGSGGFWWDQPTNNMKLNELKQFKTSLEELRGNIDMQIDEMTTRKSALINFLSVKN